MKPITEKEFKQLVDYIKVNYGVNLTDKQTLVVGRLQNYLIRNSFKNFSDYFEHVVEDKTGTAVIDLVNKLTTNHTFFMREPKHFEYFQASILPDLLKREERRRDLRIWSAGCSTGEEPYTLAMILQEYLGLEKNTWDARVLATDISTKALEVAQEGLYPSEGLKTLPPEWRFKYFKRVDSRFSVIDEKIKKEVIFRRFNLMSHNFPFKKQFHIIFCRNVMIYFDAQTRKELVDKFYDFTCPGGYLFIGHSESLNRGETKYKYVIPAVYRKD